MEIDSRNDNKRRLHDLRGYRIRLECSQGFQAKRVATFDSEDKSLISVKLLYAGAEQSDKEVMKWESPFFKNDPFVYRWLRSPFSEEPVKPFAYGISKDKRGHLWCTYYNEFYLKDESIYDAGLQIQFEVPAFLAKKKPEISIYCNEELVYQETIFHEGEITKTFDVRNTSLSLQEYIDDVRRQQKILLDRFSNICKANDLRWYLICGGLIGTIRDGGLIPWDDDLDVAMPREDFDLLMQLSSEAFRSEDLLLLNYDEYGENVFVDFMTRLLYMKETIKGDPFIRNGEQGRKDIHFHLPMDIYVLDHTYKSRIRQNLTARKLLLLYGLALGHRASFNPEKRKKNKLAGWLFGNLLRRAGTIINVQRIFRWYRKECSRKEKKGDFYYLSNGYYQCFTKQFPKEWFSDGRTECILGQNVSIPGKAEEFLKELYGDYMKYPPTWDRTPEYWKTEWIK